MYLNLKSGFCFFWSMFVGGVVGTFFVSPIGSGNREQDVWNMASAMVVGVILGGIAWKAWEARNTPLRNS